MVADQFAQHISRRYNEELETLRTDVLRMGGAVESHLSTAVEAITAGDSALGLGVARSDYKINEMEVAIDEECGRILATRAPAAGDRLLIQTGQAAASSIRTAITEPLDIAMASPTRASASFGNTGDASISAAAVTDHTDPALLSSSVIEFIDPNTYSINGAGAFAYTDGDPIAPRPPPHVPGGVDGDAEGLEVGGQVFERAEHGRLGPEARRPELQPAVARRRGIVDEHGHQRSVEPDERRPVPGEALPGSERQPDVAAPPLAGHDEPVVPHLDPVVVVAGHL